MSLHLIPSGELEEHETSGCCWCEPVSTARWRADGTYGQVVEHNGRAVEDEQSEE